MITGKQRAQRQWLEAHIARNDPFAWAHNVRASQVLSRLPFYGDTTLRIERVTLDNVAGAA